MRLSERQRKLFLLALDPAAPEGEVQAAAFKFVQSLRAQYHDGHRALQLLEGPESQVDYGATRMPFGKHRGKAFREIPPEYLLWVAHACETVEPNLRRALRRYLREDAP